MSHTELYRVRADGLIEPADRFGSAWHGAPIVWGKLAEKYLGRNSAAWMLDPRLLRRLWGLADDPAVSRAERITLLSTFDRVLCEAARFSELNWAFDEFLKEHDPLGRSHCSLMAQAIVILRQTWSYPGVLGVGWRQTSVTDCPWVVYDEETDEDRPYDINRDKGHWWLFERFEEAERARREGAKP